MRPLGTHRSLFVEHSVPPDHLTEMDLAQIEHSVDDLIAHEDAVARRDFERKPHLAGESLHDLGTGRHRLKDYVCDPRQQGRNILVVSVIVFPRCRRSQGGLPAGSRKDPSR